VKHALEQKVDGSESEAEVQARVDEVLSQNLEPIHRKRRARARQQMIDHGVAYVKEELAGEEDLNAWQRLSIARDVKQDLEEQVTGDESEDDVEAFVVGILDEVLGDSEEDAEDVEED